MTYKELTLRYKRPLAAGEVESIRRFNAAFSPDEALLKNNAGEVKIFLREINIRRLRETAKQIAADIKSGGKANGQNILADVLREVEGVKSYGIRGGLRNYVGYNKERKVANRKGKEAQREPFFYTQGHNFTREENALPQQFENAVVVGDSEEVLRRLPNNCVDLVFTSPPYNFGLDYNNSGDAAYWRDYFEKLYAVFRQCIRVTKYGGRILVNTQPLFSDYIPSHHLISNFFIGEKMIWKGEILWEKNNYNCKYTAWGSWKSPSNPYLKYTWEFIEVFCKGELKKSGERGQIDIEAEDFKKWVTAKWSIAPERKMKEYGHPAMFPEELARRVLQLFSYKNDLVLDPFNGVGSTTAVAARLNRRYLGIDISRQYCETAKKRIRQEIKNKGLYANE